MMRIHKSLQAFANFNAQYVKNKHKNAVRFETQNLNWDYQVVEYHSKAFAKGLSSFQFQQNDNFLIKLPPAQQAEAYVAKVGSAYINANLLISKATTLQQLHQEIQNNNIKGIIFEPTLQLDDQLLIDALYQLTPQAKNAIQGSQLNSKTYPSMKMLIQTNFYSYPGVYKFKSIFDYSSDKYTPFTGNTKLEPLQVPASTNPLVITQPANNFAFKAGILNSLSNGRFVVCAQPSEIPKINEIYNGKIDIIATQQCSIPDSVAAIIVPKNSGILSGKSNRIQV